MKLFMGFLLVSGIGWILDLVSYITLTQVFGLPAAYGNFISSMIGVTYVWAVALKRVFNRGGANGFKFLPVYWGYQTLSGLAYSMLISFVIVELISFKVDQVVTLPAAVLAKILVTPANLLTNFMFMAILTKFMSANADGKV
jgi:putative flippase GtrA